MALATVLQDKLVETVVEDLSAVGQVAVQKVDAPAEAGTAREGAAPGGELQGLSTW